MATRTPAQTKSVEQTPVPAPIAEAPSLDDLIEQKRALDAQIKAAREAQRTNPLERVAAWQTANPSKWIPLHLSNRVKARVKAGQPRQDAIEAVLGQFRALLEAEPETPATND